MHIREKPSLKTVKLKLSREVYVFKEYILKYILSLKYKPLNNLL